METSTVGAATTAAASSNTNGPTSGADKALSSDFETFLKMLTVQLQNQDPLNPVESTDYAVQLATFSGVEQQVKTNDLLASLSEQINTTGLSQYADWVGMTARYEGPVHFDGANPVTFNARPDASADAARLIVRDSSGAVIENIAIPASGGQMTWAGTTAGGPVAPAGEYDFQVESYHNGSLTGTTPAQVFDAVVEARIENGVTQIVLFGDNTVSPSVVSGLSWS